MDSSLTLKKGLLIAAVPILLVLLLWLVVGSSFVVNLLGLGPKPVYEEYPNSIWVSDEPAIKMVISDSPYILDDSYVIVDGSMEKVSIYVSEKEDTVLIRSVDTHGNTKGTLLSGNHVRINSSRISFHVLRDYLFDNKYSTITLKRQSV